MTTQQVGTWLLFFAAPATNLFPLLYVTFARWYGTLTGTAVVISKFGLALLVDAAVLARIHNSTTYRYHDQLVLFAFGLIAFGTWLYLIALVQQQIRQRRHA